MIIKNLVFCLFVILFVSPRILVLLAQNRTNIILVKVGIILNLDTWIGRMRLSCFNMALFNFYASHAYYKTHLLLHTRDSNSDVVAAAVAASDLIKNVQVQTIVGPEDSKQANFAIELADKAHVPILSFSATSPSLTSLTSPYFIRASRNDSSQLKAIGGIIKAFGWREAVPIYVDNEFGDGIIPYLIDALHEVNARVPYRALIPQKATDDQIVAELYKLMTMQTRVFIVHMLAPLGSRLFIKAKEMGMMDKGYVWIMTDGITNLVASLNSSVIDSMQGVLGVRTYVPKTKELDNFSIRWKTQFRHDNPSILNAELDVSGLWAYDSASALAMAVEEIIGTSTGQNFTFKKMNVSRSSSTDLDTFGINQKGPELVQALSSHNFKGLAGDFRLVDGQLQASAFEILHMNGRAERRIGFWTQQNGLNKFLDQTNSTSSSTSNTNLGPIIWPGDTPYAPKGWEIPTKGKKLQIGVPIKDGFREFVNVTFYPSTNKTMVVTGYCIDVFQAVLDELPYLVPYDFVPFAMPHGTSSGTYNDFVYQVFLQNLDEAVGDITIPANRSSYVDFTLPYTESGVSMVVPIKDSRKKDAWVFLKPLTWDLWATSVCFFAFIGFAVWVLEHRINEDFRGPALHQIGTSFWFSFSTMVFAHREQVVSNLARFIVIVWCFVVLILTQSYTASLTSLLTVRQLQPAINDVNQIIKNKQNVGYLKGSFVYGILKQLGFDDRNLKTYNSPEQLDELFTNNTENDGIIAAFDENPSLKPFLPKYCSKYTMIEPTFKANGFGFAFPMDSPLVGDISRAILKVTEGNKIKEIENKWFKTESGCPDPNNHDMISSQSLGLDSFRGLFLIAGVVTSLALLVFAATFLYENRHFLNGSESDPNASKWKRIQFIFGTFNQKDLSSHIYRKSEAAAADKSVFGGSSSPNTNCPPCPSRYSYYTDRSNFGGSLSPEPGHAHGSIINSPNGDQATPEINVSSVGDDDDDELTFPSPSSTYPCNGSTDNPSMFIFQDHDDHDFNHNGY